MKRMYGYIRVSTTKQGEGVSLEEQKLAIVRYASDQDLRIVEWFEETQSASKGKRRIFYEMLTKLKRRRADGVIIHKIDRSSRNLKDWTEISQLSDKGIDVRFAHDNVKLDSRSSRLLADIQALIAIDYSRNLSEEAKKGIYGRLRQGYYPFHAPVGYLNTGKGGRKIVDKKKAPLVVKMFELYASGEYSQERLRKKMFELGLTNNRGNQLCKNNVFRMLHNPFYMGVIKMKSVGKTFQGKHTPLISAELFEQVQGRLSNKAFPKKRIHMPLYRGLIRCERCKYMMTGEKQSDRFYYRCHQKSCETKTIREDVVTNAIAQELRFIEPVTASKKWIQQEIKAQFETYESSANKVKKQAHLQLGKLNQKLEKLTDLLVDGVITKDVYAKKQEELQIQVRKETEKTEQVVNEKDVMEEKLIYIFESVFSANISRFGQIEGKERDIANLFTSKIRVDGNKPLIELKSPFNVMQTTVGGLFCWHSGGMIRKRECEYSRSSEHDTHKKLAERLVDQMLPE